MRNPFHDKITLDSLLLIRYGVADSAGLHMFAASAGEVFLNHLQPFGEVLIFSTFSLNLDFIVKMYWGDMEPPQSMKILQVAACLVRVPTEIVKQRRQAGAGSHGLAIVRSTISSEVPATT